MTHPKSRLVLVLICFTKRKALTHCQVSCSHMAVWELLHFVLKHEEAPAPSLLPAGEESGTSRFKPGTAQGRGSIFKPLHLTRHSEGLGGTLPALRSWIRLSYPGLGMWLR